MKRPEWWYDMPAKEVLRSVNVLVSGMNCGQSVKHGWFVWASFWGALMLLNIGFLVGVYLEDQTRTLMEFLEEESKK